MFCCLLRALQHNPRVWLTAGPLRCADEGLWLPNTTRPDWLDGSLPGDRGFDPLGLSKPTEYLQVRPAATAATPCGGALGRCSMLPVSTLTCMSASRTNQHVMAVFRMRFLP